MVEPLVNPYPRSMADADLATLTHRLANLTRRAMSERMARETWALEAGFRPGCVGVLFILEAIGPASQREVSERLLLDPSDLVSLVDILERAGFLERRRDPADRRRYALELTPAGRRATGRLQEVSRMAQEWVLAPLEDDERQALAALLSRVVHHHSGQVGLEEPPPRGGPGPRREEAGPRPAEAGPRPGEAGRRPEEAGPRAGRRPEEVSGSAGGRGRRRGGS